MTLLNLPHDQDAFAPGSAAQVGRDVLGPIFAEFAQRLWMFQHFLPDREAACLMFCARGGLRLRLIYERFLARTGLPADMPFGDLMISRLVTARTACAAPGPALRQELGREFEGQTMAEVAVALTQDEAIALAPNWQQTFDPVSFFTMLRATTPEAAHVRRTIARLDGAFRRHLEVETGGRPTIILCDTGLYGSTVRLAREGMPGKTWLSAQFARSNYKRFETPHFGVTVGLSVEHDGYVPWNARTSVLRFWHLIESTLEPELASVVTFTDAAVPRSNLEVPGWRDRVGADRLGLFFGVMAHVENLCPTDLPGIGTRAEQAWKDLRRRIIWPSRGDLQAFILASPRARDFGRSENIAQFPAHAPIRDSLWREGALVERYPRWGRGAQVLLEAAHIGRSLRKLARKGR